MSCKKIKAASLLCGILTGIAGLSAADWTVETVNGVPCLLKDGEVQNNFIFTPARLTKGRKLEIDSVLPEVALTRKHGTHIYQVGIEMPWSDNDKRAWELIDYTFDEILKVDPEAYFMPRINMMYPAFAVADRTACNLGADGSRDLVAVASKRHREVNSEALRRLIRYLEKRYPDRMMGYRPGTGNHAEYQYAGFARFGNLLGYDLNTRENFKEFLRQKYGTNEKLAAAWCTPGMTFDAVMAPPPFDRVGKAGHIFLDPRRDRRVIDFNEFLQHDMADILLEWAKVIREECGKTRVTVSYYGYLFELINHRNGPSQSGHYALRKVLNSPDVDILCGPYSYYLNGRAPGFPLFTHTVGESISAAGKLWYNEGDISTHISIARREFSDGTHRSMLDRDVAETVLIVRRNIIYNLVRNYGFWWFDHHAHGMWNDPALWEEKSRFSKLEQALRQNPVPYTPEVAVTFSERMTDYVVASRYPRFTLEFSVGNMRNRAARSGTANGFYLLDDALAGNYQPKLEIHTNAAALNKQQRQTLRARAEKIPTVWMLAPGYIDTDNHTVSLQTVEETTGFKVVHSNSSRWLAWTTPDGFAYHLPDLFAGENTTQPALSPVPQPGDQILARYRDNDMPAVILRPGKDGKAFSVFCGTVDLPSSFIRALAAKAGAHVYTDRDAGIHAKEGVCAVTVTEGGLYELHVGGTDVWCDALTGEEIGHGPRIPVRISNNDTVVLCKKSLLEKAE